MKPFFERKEESTSTTLPKSGLLEGSWCQQRCNSFDSLGEQSGGISGLTPCSATAFMKVEYELRDIIVGEKNSGTQTG